MFKAHLPCSQLVPAILGVRPPGKASWTTRGLPGSQGPVTYRL